MRTVHLNGKKWSAYAHREVEVNLVSTSPTLQIGEEEVLMITTRGLCCCPSDSDRKPMDEYVVGPKSIPGYLSPGKSLIKSSKDFNAFSVPQKTSKLTDENHIHEDETCNECREKENKPTGKYTIRQANELSDYIKTETIRSLNDPNVKLQKFMDTAFFIRQLQSKLIQLEKGREMLNKSVAKEIPKEALPRLEKYFKKKVKDITRQHVLSVRTEELAKALKLKTEDVQRIKLVSMGIKFNPDKTVKSPKRGKK